MRAALSPLTSAGLRALAKHGKAWLDAMFPATAATNDAPAGLAGLDWPALGLLGLGRHPRFATRMLRMSAQPDGAFHCARRLLEQLGCALLRWDGM